MFAAALGKSILPHLAPGEQLHGAVMAQAAGSNRQLLGERAIRDVAAISVTPSGASKAVTLHVAGTAIGVETARGQPAEILPQALQRARAAAG